uniref:Dipeptidase n=2 Tax=Hemiselmis andersenii TaxID=464988 RepID=A0A6U2C3H0_HEMAN|mmetsp:Transcript_19056/g.43908  ORF Transcript_19056/g.43908 Transcript_19056/m.43908 type:complete len:409 (+) Transcript_19056:98-1324(+)
MIPAIAAPLLMLTSSSSLGVKPPPQSCDTFVVVAAEGDKLPTIFGKNSDRPNTETHEVVRFPAAEHPPGAKLRCQYIEIPQVAKTHAVVLSRPAWLWGAEMGANEHGVCCGNEAVFSRESGAADDGVDRLLGMDIVRLVLERATTAKEALEVAAGLMETHGQGGNCEDGGRWSYENGFLFADPKEAFVLETSGVHWWASERIGPGKRRNISNGISIRKPHSMHPKLLEHATAKGYWKGDAKDFDWKVAMLGGRSSADELEPEGRELAGKQWLEELAGEGKAFTWREMAKILRDTDSGICMTGGFESTGSQISTLPAGGLHVHSFTANSDTSIGCFKPFSFGPGGAVGTGGTTRPVWEAYRKAGKSKVRGLQADLRKMEEELAAEAAAAKCSPDTFDAAVQAELALVTK